MTKKRENGYADEALDVFELKEDIRELHDKQDMHAATHDRLEKQIRGLRDSLEDHKDTARESYAPQELKTWFVWLISGMLGTFVTALILLLETLL